MKGLHPDGVDKVEDSLRISGGKFLQPDGCSCQLRDSSMTTMTFSGAASDALGPVTMAPFNSDQDEDSNPET